MKFDFTKPKKSKILIYDAESKRIADVILPKKNYEIIHTRKEKISSLYFGIKFNTTRIKDKSF